MFKKLCYNATMKFKPFKKSSTFFAALAIFSVTLLTSCSHSSQAVKPLAKTQDEVYQEYMDAFEEIYETMQENYYQPIDRKDFDRFIEQFNTKIYAQLQETGKSIDFIRWRSAAFLVDFLKTDEDIFSAYYPPKPAKEYEESALGVRKDLGIEGSLTDQGFLVSQVEPRSDAYEKGLRIDDVILEIDHVSLLGLEEKAVNEMLTPLIDTKVQLKFMRAQGRAIESIEVLSKEYFKQTVFMIPIPYKGIYGLEIRRFNRKTSEDMLRFMQAFKKQGGIDGLVLDLRGNPGGPPLAAREIASFFLPGGGDFAYFQRRGQTRAPLDVPTIPSQYRYGGPIVILIDKQSGSASELFSGIMQKRGRAVLMGRNSAGQVMLKSMFHFDDESMLLLITGRGYHPDGTVFSFSGIDPDRFVSEDEEEDIIKYAANYLLYMKENSGK